MIEISHLSKTIGKNVILDDISFSVKKGEVLGFLGPNGAGKSTTMKIITSFWAPSSGSVKIAGVDGADDSLATRRLIGYLPETVPLYEEMRVYEYLKFIAEIRGLEKNRIKERLRAVSEQCGLRPVMRRPIEELSKGYRQRVGLAQAIMHEPEILILDEPTTGLDPNQIVEIRELIKSIGREKTVIFSTHILGEVSATCDRAIIINNGRLVGEGSPRELAAKAGAKELIYVKIKGPREAVEKSLSILDKVSKVKVCDQESPEIFGYEIEPKAGLDVREDLSQAVMRQNWSILEFNKKIISLEDVFRELTK